jgi:hypothetical protein
MIKYLSPTALFLYESNKQEYYFKYLSTAKPPKIPQLQVMSIGSSFDAYCKSYLIERFGGSQFNDDKYKFKTLFEAQVEEHNRTWALPNGQHVFNKYKELGGLSDLIIEMSELERAPRFEFKVEKTITFGNRSVPLLGFPDMAWYTSKGGHVIADWKVNGYESRSVVSPTAGYVKYRGVRRGKSFNKSHKDAMVMNEKGVYHNAMCKMEHIDLKWATQLTTYSWLLGQEVGSDFFVGIEQLCCGPDDFGGPPTVNLASFRNKVSKEFQFSLFDRYYQCWVDSTDGHFFKELSLEDSKKKCDSLTQVAASLQPTGDEKEDWFSRITR